MYKRQELKSTLGVGDTFEDTFEQGDKTFTITYKVTKTSPNEVSFALKNTPKDNITELSGMYEIPSSVEYNGCLLYTSFGIKELVKIQHTVKNMLVWKE